MQLFDSHAHYNDEKFESDREQVINQALENGVKKIICAGYSIESSRKAIQIANNYEHIYAIVGISPNDLPNIEELNEQIQEIESLAKENKVVGIRRNRIRLLLEQRK